MFYSGDLSVPLRYCSCCSAQVLVGLMELVVGGAFGVPEAQVLLCESKHLLPLLFPNLFGKQRVGLVAILED